MKKDVTGKEMMAKFLDRIAITARIAVENGEFTKDEVLDFIMKYGNKKIVETLEMNDRKFAFVAMAELVKTSMEIEDFERGEE